MQHASVLKRFEEIPPDRDLESLSCADFQDVDVPLISALSCCLVEVWELAEALGTWRQDEHGTILTCQHWAWKGSHPKAPMVLEPSLETRQAPFSGQVNLGGSTWTTCSPGRSSSCATCSVLGARKTLNVLGCPRCLELQTKGHPSGELNE